MSQGQQKNLFGFPFTFWAANTIELLERAAYYAVASFIVIYLTETLGMTPVKATFLNGTLLWGIIYFLPILSGTLADKYGFKKSLSLAFVLITLGYILMGNLQRFWPTSSDYTLPVVAAILLIGIGGSFVKPCISGTVQKTSGLKTTLGFGIFYMTINIGSMCGRIVSYFVRTRVGLPAIFSIVATLFAVIGILVVLFIYREPKYQEGESQPTSRPKTLTQALTGMVTVLKDLKFVFFLIVIGFYWFIYVQIYNLIPLFLRFIDPTAPVELYTLVNPVMIVFFQLLITKVSKRWIPLQSMRIGIGITVVGMLLNILPFFLKVPLSSPLFSFLPAIPAAGFFMLLSLACMAIGEMMTSPRIYEYIGAISPKGQEGLYLGYANLPVALGTIVGAPLGGYFFKRFILQPHGAGEAVQAPTMWAIVAAMGVVSIVGLSFYDKLIRRNR